MQAVTLMPTKHVHTDLRELLSQVSSIDILAHERSDTQAVQLLAAEMSNLASRASQLADTLIELAPDECADDNAATQPYSLQGRAVPHSLPQAPLHLGDLAFIMRMEMLHKQRALRNALHGPRIALLSECESCKRRLQKSLWSLSACVSGEVPALAPVSNIQRSLLVRQCYAKFRSQVLLLPPLKPTEESLRKNLRVAGTLIAMLVGSNGYPYFRVSDRHQVASLQRRILSALSEPTAVTTGSRVLQDFKAFVELLSLVNHRQELKEHDTHYVRVWLVQLQRQEPCDAPLELAAYRARLYGLDPDLDAIFDSTSLTNCAELVRTLQGLVPLQARTAGDLPTKRESQTPHNPDGTLPQHEARSNGLTNHSL